MREDLIFRDLRQGVMSFACSSIVDISKEAPQ